MDISGGRLLGTALVTLVVGLYFVVDGIKLASLQAKLNHHGVVTQARLIETSRTTESRRSSSYYADLRYKPEGGKQTIATTQVSKDFILGRKVGDDVEIRYLPEDPKTIHIEGASKSGWLRLLSGLVGVGLGVLMGRMGLKSFG